MIRRAMMLIATLATTQSVAHAQPRPNDGATAVALVNLHRRASGLAPVKSDPTLARAARYQTAAMVQQGRVSHSAGGEFGSRIRAFGIRGVAAENLGYGYATIAEAIAGWQRSASHNANLLNPYIARIGVAGQTGPDGRAYWTMILAQ